MKIYITRKPASAIYSRGLEAIQVWLRKPAYAILRWGDSPFSDTDHLPYGMHGMWQCDYHVAYGPYQNYIPFSELFGFADDKNENRSKIAEEVWLKVCEHFHNEDFDKWEKLEADGKSKLQDFYIEMDIDIVKING